MQALEGIKVLDLSQLVSGSYCAKLLGALGAEIIKIETPARGDQARNAGPFLEDTPHPERSALFLYLNTNKKGITLNLETEAGVNIFKVLLKDADVLIENFKPGYMPGLGLGYETLEKINSSLVMVSVTDFGQTGPYKDYKGGRLVANALSGYMYINGNPEREPLAGGGEQPAYQGGLHAYAGIMAALISRETTGQGQYIDVSIMECMASIHQFTINRYVYSGKIQNRIGNRYMYSHPTTIYPCKDGYVSISPSMDEQAERMLLLMEMPHLLEDPRFETGFHRLAHAEEFDELVKPWFLERSKEEIVKLCQEWRVPAAYVNNVADLLDDEQYKARHYWVMLDHPETGMRPYAGPPFKMSETPTEYERAPLLGEHNDEIYLGRLGLSRDELEKLRENGVV
ncbi:MAG: CoA transferase [Deltaproteobacteria bacterium]|nr:CoA transferase [Deltaproteobacteria bacterium]MBW2053046.1 CoA transferase [Deltaproteobacteria bacterium]MBW2141265.1 CoA transferase [Deltaproteobacteria bacterium]MBW2322835.1 CoA transferase [Deltaproteobacteria bacterium]